MKMGHTLVLGGARSGKSGYAERLAGAHRLAKTYLATAEALDAEMAARIARHRANRVDEGWETIEVPLDLPATIRKSAAAGRILLVDCLTLWLSNIMLGGGDVTARQADLLACLAAADGPVILVSNEVGMGLVPETPLGRAFRDAQGRLNQAVAAVVPHVVFVAAGLPLVLKPAPAPGVGAAEA
jgi:adenosylcobinamide kinase / adenosylcobinamide-phosphate guanylyltransferase